MASMRKRTSDNAKNCQSMNPSLSLVYLDLGQIQANPENPRVHSKEQIKQIAQSIENFGLVAPLLIDRNLRLIAGHGRAEALKLLGIRKVPTICLEHLSESKARAFTIADNRLAEIASWDNQKLAKQFKILTEITLDFSPESTGFAMGEIDMIMEGLSPTRSKQTNSEDELPQTFSELQVTEADDLWLLGPNRLFCGDALDERAYSLLMDGQRAACVFLDPPYKNPIDGNVSGFGKVHRSELATASGEMSKTEFTEFLHTAISRLVSNSTAGSLHFIFMDWRHTPELLAAAGKLYAEFKNLCVWVKNKRNQGSLYRGQHELVFVFNTSKDRHRNNIELGR
jgi:hypothetical protein